MIVNVLESTYKFTCVSCDYYTSRKSQYARHLATTKHKLIVDDSRSNLENIDNTYTCVCGKIYKYDSGYYRHKKECTFTNDTIMQPETSSNTSQIIDVSIVVDLLKQNQEFKELMIEQSKQLSEQQNQNKLLLEQHRISNQTQQDFIDAVKDGKLGNNTNCNNTNSNNKFNLNFFLNETCKDAITMNDFIQTMEVTIEDFVSTGKLGFVDGISKVIVERMKEMEMHTRPMHCTDLKRETIYIKDDSKWEKDDDNKVLRNAVKRVAKKNHAKLRPWFDNSQPEVEQLGTEECENYFQYYKAALGGYGKEEETKFEDKIMRNVMKETMIDKQMIV